MSTEVNKDILYLVTGAAGFLGGTVCRQLIDNGCKVRAFILPNDPAKKYIIAVVERTVEEFKETDAYKKLPETEKEAEGKGECVKFGRGISYETGENSYQMAFVEETESPGFTVVL